MANYLLVHGGGRDGTIWNEVANLLKMQGCELTIRDFEKICSDIPRRSLQRDLKDLVDKKLLATEGATNQLVYKLAP